MKPRAKPPPPWDDQPDGPEQWTAAWFAAHKAHAAASLFAADEDEEDEEDAADDDEDAEDAAAVLKEEVSGQIAAAERAAKYAARDDRWAAGNAAEAVAERVAKSRREYVPRRNLSPTIAEAARSAEYSWQATRLAEIVGIEL